MKSALLLLLEFVDRCLHLQEYRQFKTLVEDAEDDEHSEELERLFSAVDNGSDSSSGSSESKKSSKKKKSKKNAKKEDAKKDKKARLHYSVLYILARYISFAVFMAEFSSHRCSLAGVFKGPERQEREESQIRSKAEVEDQGKG